MQTPRRKRPPRPAPSRPTRFPPPSALEGRRCDRRRRTHPQRAAQRLGRAAPGAGRPWPERPSRRSARPVGWPSRHAAAVSAACLVLARRAPAGNRTGWCARDGPPPRTDRPPRLTRTRRNPFRRRSIPATPPLPGCRPIGCSGSGPSAAWLPSSQALAGAVAGGRRALCARAAGPGRPGRAKPAGAATPRRGSQPGWRRWRILVLRAPVHKGGGARGKPTPRLPIRPGLGSRTAARGSGGATA